MNETANAELDIAKVRISTQLDDLIQLRPLPATALQIMKACRNEELNVQDLIQLVECDPAISTRVLSMVNSSMYGYSREIASIDQAVVVLGFKSLSQLAVSIAAEKVFSEGDVAVDARSTLFDHSLGCAAVARLLAKHSGLQSDSGAAFLAGMLHDVGKLVFFDVAPNAYLDMHELPHANLLEREQDAFGINHTAIGKKFGEHWGLPATINEAIAGHHQKVDETSEPILWITSLANELARHWGIGQKQQLTQSQAALDWINEQSQETLDTYRGDASQHFADIKTLLSS